MQYKTQTGVVVAATEIVFGVIDVYVGATEIERAKPENQIYITKRMFATLFEPVEK